MNKTIPKKKKGKNVKWLSEEALQIAEERRAREKKKSKGERERYIQLNADFQRKAERQGLLQSTVYKTRKKTTEG